MFSERLEPVRLEQRNALQLLHRNETRAHAIIDIVRVIRNLISQVAQLRLQTGLLTQ